MIDLFWLCFIHVYVKRERERRRRRAMHTDDNAKEEGDRSVTTPDAAEPRRVSLAFGADALFCCR